MRKNLKSDGNNISKFQQILQGQIPQIVKNECFGKNHFVIVNPNTVKISKTF